MALAALASVHFMLLLIVAHMMISLNTLLRSVSAALLYTNYQATTKNSLIERVLVKQLRYENSLAAQLLMILLIKSTAC